MKNYKNLKKSLSLFVKNRKTDFTCRASDS